MLRWGIIGAGKIADQSFIPAIKKSQHSELIAVMARNEEKMKALCENHRAKRFYSDVSRLCDDPEVNCVYVASPPFQHCEHTLMSASAKKHVLCEKPMAVDIHECEKMIEACQLNGVKLMIANMMRFHKPHRLVKNMIKQGMIGKVTVVKSDFFISLRQIQGQDFNENQFRLSRTEGGGGAIMDLGIHCIDTLRYILDREITEVFSFNGALSFKTEVEDAAVMVLRFDNDIFGSINLNYNVPYANNNVAFYGEKGVIITIDSMEQVPDTKVKIYLKGSWKEETVPLEDSYVAEIEHFHQCIREDQTPLIDGEEGMKDLKVVLTCYESMRQGKAVTVT